MSEASKNRQLALATLIKGLMANEDVDLTSRDLAVTAAALELADLVIESNPVASVIARTLTAKAPPAHDGLKEAREKGLRWVDHDPEEALIKFMQVAQEAGLVTKEMLNIYLSLSNDQELTALKVRLFIEGC